MYALMELRRYLFLPQESRLLHTKAHSYICNQKRERRGQMCEKNIDERKRRTKKNGQNDIVTDIVTLMY